MSDRILIVGGGIAGLSAAAALSRAGWRCEVVERTPQWAPIGAGIVMSVTAMRVLRDLGIAEEVRERGAALGRAAITDAAGRSIGATNFAELEPEFGPTVALHRADLHAALLGAAGETPIHLGTTVDRLALDDDGVSAVFSDGREARYALVLGADGLRSRVRELVFGETPLWYSGYACWRTVVDLPGIDVALCEMWGRGRRFGIAPVGGGRVYSFMVLNTPPGQPDPAAGRIERVRREFAEFGGDAPRVLAAVESPEQLIYNDLEDLIDHPWQCGRVLLVGDAAHAMTPNMGLGAAMALEDSWVLGQELSQVEDLDKAPLRAALAAYEERRRSRVHWVQRQSRRIGQIGQLASPWLGALRNVAFRAIPDRMNRAALERMARQPV